MNELDAIVGKWEKGAVLATVVNVKGSAYRRPGARMLMMPDGSRIGSISGGCLESDVAKKAWWLTEDGRPVLRTYDTTSEDDAIWEFGLGCNGVVEVLLERMDRESSAATLNFIGECRRARKAAVVATVIRGGEVGDRLLLHPDGTASGELASGSAVLAHALQAMRDHRSFLVQDNDTELFVEFLAPRIPLVIFGAGHDALPLVAIAEELGWHVTVADGRPAYLQPSRLSGVDEIILLPSENPASAVKIDADSVVVLMTHNYPQDREILRNLLPLKPRYLGLLGPKARTERMLKELGETPTPHLHAPIGLDIGADSPQAIALSIVAEIQAVLSGRSGNMLRFRPGPIYDATHFAAPARELDHTM